MFAKEAVEKEKCQCQGEEALGGIGRNAFLEMGQSEKGEQMA
jgi:hypothetical protein